MSNRIRFMGYHISRYPMNIARYTMLSHAKAKPNPKRYEKLSNGLKRYENDGLNSVKYQLVDNKKFPLFTWFLVKLQPEVMHIPCFARVVFRFTPSLALCSRIAVDSGQTAGGCERVPLSQVRHSHAAGHAAPLHLQGALQLIVQVASMAN